MVTAHHDRKVSGTVMLAFLMGTLVGGMVGIVTMCLLQINRLHRGDTEVGR